MPVGLLPSVGEEQQMLLDSTTRFIDDHCPLPAVRQRADTHEPLSASYRAAAAELGWFGLLAREEHGGGSVSGNGLLDAALIAAERGARLQPGPFAGHSVVVHALSTDASVSHLDLLARLIGGECWATWAFSERVDVTARTDGAGLVLEGSISAIADADECTWFLVNARGSNGMVQVLVPSDAAGLAVRSMEALDVTRRWSRIELREVRVGPDQVVGAPGETSEALMGQQAQIAAVLVAAESVGAMESDFASAVRYAKDRIAFGRPIGSFQAIKHVLADSSLWLEMAKGIVAAAATALGSGAADGPSLAHAAKSFVAERGLELAQNCFQVLGGIGYTWEHDQHFYLRRIAADGANFGSPAWHRTQMLEEEGVR